MTRRKQWRAPWTDEQVGALRKRQANELYHPYACGNDSSHPPLVPTRDGWICEACDYRQTWAHAPAPDLMANLRRSLEHLRADHAPSEPQQPGRRASER